MVSLGGFRFPEMTVGARRGAVVACVMIVTMVGSATWRVSLDRQNLALRSNIAFLTQKLKTASIVLDDSERGPDFAQRLPVILSVDPIVGELQRASAAEGAVFLTVLSTPHAPTGETLGRSELSVGLRGSYPQVKAILAQMLDRYPELIVQRLMLKRLSTPGELDARIDLLLLTGPRTALAAAR